MLLRLSDLPAGYVLGNDSGCGPFTSTEGQSETIDALLVEQPASGCIRDFRYRAAPEQVDVPPRVQSAVLFFTDTDQAQSAVDLGTELLSAMAIGGDWTPSELTGEALGEQRIAATTSKASTGEGPEEASAILWRQGHLVYWVAVAGLQQQANTNAVGGLAAIQHGYHMVPATTEPLANDDLEVRLNRSDLGVPVYWLGREFAPAGELPAIEMQHAHGPIGPEGGPGWNVDIGYGLEGQPAARVRLGIWTAERWEAFTATELGQAVLQPRCARVTELALPDGRANIHATYRPPPEGEACPPGEPSHYLAVVTLSDAIVTVNMPFSWSALEEPPGAPVRNLPYNTEAAMEAVVRALQKR